MSEQEILLRVGALEQQARRMRIAIAALAIVALGLAAGVVEAFREHSDFEQHGLRTTRVVVTSDSGAYSALGSHAHEPYFKFVDERNTFRLFCSLGSEGPALSLADSAGKPRLRLSTSDQGGRIELLNADGTTHWTTP